MKFMKLGSKPDSFRTDEDNVRYVASELASDIVIIVDDVKFYLHKFPLLSKSARLQKLVAITSEENNNDDEEIHITDIPGGPAAFEICAKFCYGMTVTLSPYNVVAARCAAEYLEMYETIEKGNLIYKIDVFLNSSIFRTWKDSIIVFQTTKSFLPWSEELKIVSHCLDSIASKVSIDTSKVEWSYTYNRKKLNEPQWDDVRKQPLVPKDWWVEDLCELHIDLYKRVIMTIKTKGRISADLIGESLKEFTLRRLPDLNKVDVVKSRVLVDTIISLLPIEKNSVCCSFLLKLLQACITLECEQNEVHELKRRIGQQLESATTADLIFKVSPDENTICNIDIVNDVVKEFLIHEQSAQNDFPAGPGFLSNTSKAKVAKLVDGYLAETARDPNLPLSKFVDLAETVSAFPRSSHDGLYRAIDTYLKEHEGISKSERKKICRLMDCRKLSSNACTYAVQNERLPLRVVVQILFFEQMRATTSASCCSTPDLPGPIRALLPGGSHGSSRSTTTNTEEDWDSVPTAEELKALTGELATLRLREDHKGSSVKGLVMSKKIFSKLWSSKEKNSENSSSDTSESPCSTQETKSITTPCRSRRQSLS